MELEGINISEVCRLCLCKKYEMKSMTEGNIVDLLQECASVKVSVHNSPHLVCSECANEVNKWHSFKQKIMRAFEIGTMLMEQKLKEQESKEKTNCTVPTDNMLELTHIIKVEEEEIEMRDEVCHTEEKPFLCTHCSMSFTMHSQLKSHMNYTHLKQEDSICKEKNTLQEHIKTHTGERTELRHKCQQCGKRCHTTSQLRIHVRSVHTGERPFSCNVCKKGFVDAYSLKIHMRVHTGEKPFLCTHCSKSFTMHGQLKSHIKYRHTKQKDFVCNVCARAFTAKNTLQEHIRTHTGEKKEPKHECQQCGKKFQTTSQLGIHVKSLHTGEKPFSCNVCEKGFVTKARLEAHVRTHTGERNYVCDSCGKAFTSTSSLKTHTRIHTGEKPYGCEICGKNFTQGSILKTHMKVHAAPRLK